MEMRPFSWIKEDYILLFDGYAFWIYYQIPTQYTKESLNHVKIVNKSLAGENKTEKKIKKKKEFLLIILLFSSLFNIYLS